MYVTTMAAENQKMMDASFELWCDDHAATAPWPPTRASFAKFWSERPRDPADVDEEARVWASYKAGGFKIVLEDGTERPCLVLRPV